MPYKNNTKGFTLIELIVYVAIVAFVLVATTTFSWNIMGSQTQINVSSEIVQNGRIIFENLKTEIKSAENFTLEEGAIILDDGRASFILENQDVELGGERVENQKLVLNQGNSSIELNSDKVSVSKFEVQDLSRGPAKSLKLDLTLEYLNPGEDPNRNSELTLNTAFTLKQ